MNHGGTIFVDHASSLIHVKSQKTLGSTDTIQSKRLFERMAMTNGVRVLSYHGDNGSTFVSSEFKQHLAEL